MTKHTLAALSAVAIAMIPAAAPANAFSRGCGHHADRCYEKVRQPDVYATVQRKVLVQPAYKELVFRSPVYGRRAERVVVRPSHAHIVVEPAVYETRMSRVLVKPARLTYEHVPAVVRTARERVVVAQGGYRWERRLGLLGRDRVCKIRVAPVTRTSERQIVVRPEGRVRRIVPALYRQVPRRILVRAARKHRHYFPEISKLVYRTVLLESAQRLVHRHPAMVGKLQERVRVRDGGYRWQASHHRGLFGR